MDPVRPAFPQALQRPASPEADAARLAAQKAFFEIAMGRAAPPGAPAPGVQATAAAAPAQPSAQVSRIPDPRATAPEKILRPGSLLDIRV